MNMMSQMPMGGMGGMGGMPGMGGMGGMPGMGGFSGGMAQGTGMGKGRTTGGFSQPQFRQPQVGQPPMGGQPGIGDRMGWDPAGGPSGSPQAQIGQPPTSGVMSQPPMGGQPPYRPPTTRTVQPGIGIDDGQYLPDLHNPNPYYGTYNGHTQSPLLPGAPQPPQSIMPGPAQPTNKYANNGITSLLGAAQQTVNPAATPMRGINNTMGSLGDFSGRSMLPQNNNTIPYQMQATDNYDGFYSEPYAALKPGMNRSDLGNINAGGLGASAGFRQ